MNSAERIYGRTGEIGKDGLLTPEQSEVLNRRQEKAAVASIDYLDQMTDDQDYPLVAMATGIGKGNIIHRVIEKQVRRKPDSKVLVIAGTKITLVKQTHEALATYQQQKAIGNGFDYIFSEEDDEFIPETTTLDSEDNPLEGETSFLYKTGKITDKDVNVHVATIQTVQSEIQKDRLNPHDYDLVVVDEVHNVGTNKRKAVIQQFKKVVGFTATPVRYSGRMKAPEQYGFTVIESLPLPEAQELRLLPPLVGIQIDTTSVLEDNIPTTQTGSIDYKKLEQLLKGNPNLRPYIADRLVNIISKDGRNYKTVIAVNFVWEAQELAELLKHKGIKVGIAVNQQAAKQLHSEEIPAIDSIERYKLADSDEKSLQVIISPYVLGEGFDAPATEVLVWASPTDSDLRYTQYTGRLARRSEGKRFGVIVDCLYQINQYNWSYNMGMWMKGNVRVLDNGLLYLGPETDIEDIKKLPQAQVFIRESAKKPLDELQAKGLLEVQETDFAVTESSLSYTFVGNRRKLSPIAQQVLEEVRRENPELLEKRRSGPQIVDVVTDKQRFIQGMINRRATLRLPEIQKVKETDFAVTESSLSYTFVGNRRKLSPIAQQVLEEVRRENPELVVKRKKGRFIVNAITDRQRFIEEMIKKGVSLKSPEIEEVKETDFAVTNSGLRSTFIGSEQKLSPIAQQVLEEVRRENPELLVERTKVSNRIDVVTDRQRFIDEMIKRGVKLKPTK